MADGERLAHSDYQRGGHALDVGRLWEVDTGPDQVRSLKVYASERRIRVVDNWCGEWEMAERSAVLLTPTQARAVGEILLAAADVAESRSSIWRSHSIAANPDPELDRLRREQRQRFDERMERDRQQLAKGRGPLRIRQPE